MPAAFRASAGLRDLLYELYDDEAAFRAHLATPHFLQFNEQTAPWVASKSVATYQRAWPAT